MTKKHHKKKTVGAHAVERQQVTPDTRDPIELQRETEKGYIEALKNCALENIKYYAGDFYIVVLNKNEKLLYNVIRCYFIARSTCPTPDYDQTVFIFKREKETIEHLWTVPDKETCLVYLREQDKVVPEEYPLLENIIKFQRGELFKLCKRLNNEEIDSILLAS
jgi:hypothetical protein